MVNKNTDKKNVKLSGAELRHAVTFTLGPASGDTVTPANSTEIARSLLAADGDFEKNKVEVCIHTFKNDGSSEIVCVMNKDETSADFDSKKLRLAIPNCWRYLRASRYSYNPDRPFNIYEPSTITTNLAPDFHSEIALGSFCTAGQENISNLINYLDKIKQRLLEAKESLHPYKLASFEENIRSEMRGKLGSAKRSICSRVIQKESEPYKLVVPVVSNGEGEELIELYRETGILRSALSHIIKPATIVP